jgi:serine/threonine protein kinase
VPAFWYCLPIVANAGATGYNRWRVAWSAFPCQEPPVSEPPSQSDRYATDDPGLPPARENPLATRPSIGRYRITKTLGRGGFGEVFLAYDDELHRPVAIKVPHRERVARPEDAEAYLAEARVLAGLDYPHIVPVNDVGRTDQGLPFIVSKYIAGNDLAARLRESPLALPAAVELVAAIAENVCWPAGRTW